MFDYSKKLGTISSSQSYTLPSFTDGTPEFTHFLLRSRGWCRAVDADHLADDLTGIERLGAKPRVVGFA